VAETEHTGKGNPLDGSLSGDGERGWVGGHAAPRGSSAVSAWRSTASGRGAPRETVRCPPRQLVLRRGAPRGGGWVDTQHHAVRVLSVPGDLPRAGDGAVSTASAGVKGPLEARTTRQRKPALQHITSGTRSSSSSSSGGYPTHL
jgi:hypothetical protein